VFLREIKRRGKMLWDETYAERSLGSHCMCWGFYSDIAGCADCETAARGHGWDAAVSISCSDNGCLIGGGLRPFGTSQSRNPGLAFVDLIDSFITYPLHILIHLTW
jgi:hypothetical protein